VHGVAGGIKVVEAAIFEPPELIVIQVDWLPSGGNSLQDFNGLCVLIGINPEINVARWSESALRIESANRPALQQNGSNACNAKGLD